MANLSLSTGVYRFRVDGTSNVLKIGYSSTSSITSAAAIGTAIKTGALNGFRSELWYLNGSVLYTEYGRTLGIRFLAKNTSNKAELASYSDTLTFEQVDSGTYKGKKCKIKMGTYYLVSNGTQCTFTTTAASGTTWRVEAIRRMTDMPADGGYAERVEYFHPTTFSADGKWNSALTTKVKAFYSKVFGTSGTDANCMYNLYGALMTSGDYIGKFHLGVDMYKANGNAIKSAHTGKVTKATTAGGQIAFNGLSPNRIYLHLAPSVANNAQVSVGEQIGVQQSPYNHLHFEVNSSGTSQNPPADSNDAMNAKSPYDYM